MSTTNIQNITTSHLRFNSNLDFGASPSLGHAFVASTPAPANPAPEGDDPRVIECASAPSPEAVARAEALLKRPRRFIGEERFAAAVACALLFRDANLTAPDALERLEHLNQDLCEPPLEPSRLDDALFAAYAEPAVAEQITTDALSGVANDAPRADPPANHETPLVEPETGIVDRSAAVGPGAHDTGTGDNALARPVEPITSSLNASVTTKITRKVGRPPGRTKDRLFQMRVGNTFITKIDDRRRQQPDFPNRTQSVQRLVEQALAATEVSHVQ